METLQELTLSRQAAKKILSEFIINGILQNSHKLPTKGNVLFINLPGRLMSFENMGKGVFSYRLQVQNAR